MQKLRKTTIAVVHVSIELGSRAKNIEKVKDSLNKIKDKDVKIVVIPAMINGIPIFTSFARTMKIRRTAEIIPGHTSQSLDKLSIEFNKNLIVGPILERRGSKVYISSFYIVPHKGVTNIIRHTAASGDFLRSTELPIIVDNDMKICILYGRDIFLPEVSLSAYLLGIDVAIAYPDLDYDLYKQKIALVTRALELNSIVISVGGIITRKGEPLIQLPTIIIDEEGDIVNEISEGDRVILVDIEPKSKRKYIDYGRKNLLKKLRKLIAFES